jgi:RB1-inducible coiled-coil protein 1
LFLLKFDQNVLDTLRRDIEAALQASSKTDMKEIKGLEERLYGLEQLMFETRRIVQEQTDLAQVG